jgi:hypothetical protein
LSDEVSTVEVDIPWPGRRAGSRSNMEPQSFMAAIYVASKINQKERLREVIY